MGGSRVKQNLGCIGIDEECTFHHCPTGPVISRYNSIDSARCWLLLLDRLCCNRLYILHLLESVHLTIHPLYLGWLLLPLLRLPLRLLVLLRILLLILLVASTSLILALVSTSLALLSSASLLKMLLASTSLILLILTTALTLLELLVLRVLAATLALELPLLSSTLLVVSSSSSSMTSSLWG